MDKSHPMTEDVTGGDAGQHTSTSVSPPIDIEQLAEKVYQLMREEIRLAQARGKERRTRK